MVFLWGLWGHREKNTWPSIGWEAWIREGFPHKVIPGCVGGWHSSVPSMWKVPGARKRKLSFSGKFQSIQYDLGVWFQMRLKMWAKVKPSSLALPLCPFHILMHCVWVVPPKLLNLKRTEDTVYSSLSFWYCWTLTPATFSEHASHMTQLETLDIESNHLTRTFAFSPPTCTYQLSSFLSPIKPEVWFA